MCSRILATSVLVLVLALSGCDILPAIAPPSATPTSTATRVPTRTPTRTASPTSTPVPEPDAKAMIAWQELGFAREFFAAPPSMLGIDEGAELLRLGRPDGSKLPLRVAGSFFFFSEKEPSLELVAGYSFHLPTAADAAMFDNYARNQAHDFASPTLHPQEPPTRVADFVLTEQIGDASGAATIEYQADGSPAVYSTVVFRTGGIGAVVFVNRALDLKTPVSVEKLARVYAESIRNPPEGCKIKSVAALEDSPIPGFRFAAEGFYPWEGRMIFLGDAAPGGFGSGKLGGGGESADRYGVIADTIFATTVVPSGEAGSLASEPQEYRLSVVGTASGCKAEQTVVWPGAEAATRPAPGSATAKPQWPPAGAATLPAIAATAATPQWPPAGAATWPAPVAGAASPTSTLGLGLASGSPVPPTATGTLLSSGNLALGQSITVSRVEYGRPAANAVDGNRSTYWGSGDFAPQWVEVDLGAPARVTGLRLLVGQSPDGYTDHRITARNSTGEEMEVHRFYGLTRDLQWLVFTPEKPLEDVRFVRVQTMASPSWVSWWEVQVLGER